MKFGYKQTISTLAAHRVERSNITSQYTKSNTGGTHVRIKQKDISNERKYRNGNINSTATLISSALLKGRGEDSK
jgi:hypothetical protein